MSEYIVMCDEETASWIGNDVDSMRPLVRCRDCRHMFDWAYDVPMCKLWAFNDPDDSNASSGNALYPTVELDGYCWRGERR